MRIENIKKANEIQKRMEELARVMMWMEDKDRNIYVLAQGCTMDESVKLSSDERSLLYGLVVGVHARLQEEFEEL